MRQRQTSRKLSRENPFSLNIFVSVVAIRSQPSKRTFFRNNLTRPLGLQRLILRRNSTQKNGLTLVRVRALFVCCVIA